jgi:hypothetical protein
MNFRETTLDINQIPIPGKLPTPNSITQNRRKFGVHTTIGIIDDPKIISQTTLSKDANYHATYRYSFHPQLQI